MNKISVIVPIYNVEQYLDKCINSIIKQTYNNLEIILVDDGSPDNCGKICDYYAKIDSRIKVIHKENGGLSDARNAGLDIATGDYIGFVDSDDYIAPEMYEVLFNRIKQDESDLCICSFLIIDNFGNKIEGLNNKILVENEILVGKNILNGLFKYGVYFTTAVNRLYSRKIADGFRFPIGKLHEDEFSAHRILEQCERVSVIPEPLYFYVQRKGSITNTKYNIKKLDAAEAYVDRIRCFFDNDLIEYGLQYMWALIDMVLLAYKELKKRTKNDNKRIKEILKQIKLLRAEINNKIFNRKLKAKLSLFCFSPKLYCIITKNGFKFKKFIRRK